MPFELLLVTLWKGKITKLTFITTYFTLTLYWTSLRHGNLAFAA